jgi:8-oxo-dGTP pyrophosphatase MutT (NUDIX family)
MPRKWRYLQSQRERSLSILSLRTDTAVSPRTGETHEFHILESPPWVNILPLTPEEKVVLVRQQRHGIREATLELPGGLVESGDSPREAALRELREETGYGPGTVSHLGSVHPNPAFLDNQCHMFLCRGAEPTGKQDLDEKEDIRIETLPLRDIPGMIADGSITHSLVLCAFFYFFLDHPLLLSGERP